MGQLLWRKTQSNNLLINDNTIRCSVIKTKFCILSIDCAPNGKHFVCAVDTILQIYDLRDSKQVGKDMPGQGYIMSVQYSRSGGLIAATCSLWAFRIWDSVSQELITTYNTIQAVLSICFSSDDRYVIIGSHDRSVRIWEIQNSQQQLIQNEGVYLYNHKKYKVKVEPDYINTVQYSKCGKYILSMFSEYKIQIWNFKQNYRFRLYINQRITFQTEISENGQIIAAPNKRKLQVWSFKAGKIMRKVKHELSVMAPIAYSPDQTTIAFGANKYVFLWNIMSGHCTGPVVTQNFMVASVKFTKCGLFLVSESLHNQIQINQAFTNTDDFQQNYLKDSAAN